MQMKPGLSLVLLLVAACHAGPLNRYPGGNTPRLGRRNDTEYSENVCVIDDVIYQAGDYVPATDPCDRCVCHPLRGVSCSPVTCIKKPGCKALLMAGQCCPEYQCECEYGGKIYQNGERLENPDNMCDVCYCRGGEVSCKRIECYRRDDCEPQFVPGRCCPKYDHCPPIDQPRPQLNRANISPSSTSSDLDVSVSYPQQRLDDADLDKEASEDVSASISIDKYTTANSIQNDDTASSTTPTEKDDDNIADSNSSGSSVITDDSGEAATVTRNETNETEENRSEIENIAAIVTQDTDKSEDQPVNIKSASDNVEAIIPQANDNVSGDDTKPVNDEMVNVETTTYESEIKILGGTESSEEKISNTATVNVLEGSGSSLHSDESSDEIANMPTENPNARETSEAQETVKSSEEVLMMDEPNNGGVTSVPDVTESPMSTVHAAAGGDPEEKIEVMLADSTIAVGDENVTPAEIAKSNAKENTDNLIEGNEQQSQLIGEAIAELGNSFSETAVDNSTLANNFGDGTETVTEHQSTEISARFQDLSDSVTKVTTGEESSEKYEGRDSIQEGWTDTPEYNKKEGSETNISEEDSTAAGTDDTRDNGATTGYQVEGSTADLLESKMSVQLQDGSETDFSLVSLDTESNTTIITEATETTSESTTVLPNDKRPIHLAISNIAIDQITPLAKERKNDVDKDTELTSDATVTEAAYENDLTLTTTVASNTGANGVTSNQDAEIFLREGNVTADINETAQVNDKHPNIELFNKDEDGPPVFLIGTELANHEMDVVVATTEPIAQTQEKTNQIKHEIHSRNATTDSFKADVINVHDVMVSDDPGPSSPKEVKHSDIGETVNGNGKETAASENKEESKSSESNIQATTLTSILKESEELVNNTDVPSQTESNDFISEESQTEGDTSFTTVSYGTTTDTEEKEETYAEARKAVDLIVEPLDMTTSAQSDGHQKVTANIQQEERSKSQVVDSVTEEQLSIQESQDATVLEQATDKISTTDAAISNPISNSETSESVTQDDIQLGNSQQLDVVLTSTQSEIITDESLVITTEQGILAKEYQNTPTSSDTYDSEQTTQQVEEKEAESVDNEAASDHSVLETTVQTPQEKMNQLVNVGESSTSQESLALSSEKEKSHASTLFSEASQPTVLPLPPETETETKMLVALSDSPDSQIASKRSLSEETITQASDEEEVSTVLSVDKEYVTVKSSVNEEVELQTTESSVKGDSATEVINLHAAASELLSKEVFKIDNSSQVTDVTTQAEDAGIKHKLNSMGDELIPLAKEEIKPEGTEDIETKSEAPIHEETLGNTEADSAISVEYATMEKTEVKQETSTIQSLQDNNNSQKNVSIDEEAVIQNSDEVVRDTRDAAILEDFFTRHFLPYMSQKAEDSTMV